MMQIGNLPRVKLADLPTPLEKAPRLGKALGGINLYIKRDDNTGLCMGGNKARKLEYLLAEAMEQGCDTVITTGGAQSNHARMTAAGARKLGMKPVLVLEGPKPEGRQGNLLLDDLVGAEVLFVAKDSDMGVEMESVAKRLRASGSKPYIVPLGGSNPLGSIGYVAAAVELCSQAFEEGIKIDHAYLTLGSGGTMAGFALGMKVLMPEVKVWGISVSRKVDLCKQRVIPQAQGAAKIAGIPFGLEPEELLVDDAYIGPGYAIPTAECLEMIRLAASTEGIILDPVYTGKTMAGLAGHVTRGLVKPGETVVFIHTGGAPAIFAFEQWF